MSRIRHARQPKREAQRIIEHYRSLAVGDLGQHNDVLDLSDLRELEVKLVRRDQVIDPLQISRLKRLARQIAKRTLTPAQFREEAAALLAIPSTLKKEMRMAEARLLRSDG